jgi:hypothetical protein
MKNKLFIIIATAVLFLTGCEKKEPPVYIIGLLSEIELTKIPQDGLYYSCIEINTVNPEPQYTHTFVTPKPISKRDLPIKWVISGGQRLDKENEPHAVSIVSIDESGNSTILLAQKVPTFMELKALGYPEVLHCVENGVVCKLIFHYS